jgi:hypothetical protein
MSDLLMLVPSRSRPESIARLRDAWQETVRGNSRLVVLVDDDDPVLKEYQELDVSVELSMTLLQS